MGLTLIRSNVLNLFFVMNYGKGFFYETDRREAQKKSQILAYQLPSGEWTGAPAFGSVRDADPPVRLVVSSGSVASNFFHGYGEGKFNRASDRSLVSYIRP